TALSYDSLSTMNFIRRHPKIVDVDYLGNMEAFTWYSAKDVLDGKLKREEISGKIVIVGALSIFDDDRFHTPINIDDSKSDMFGVIYLANVVNQILNDK
ncbi:MAG: CHASE2 domain-containing protein, partial [Cyclobacteriaceae bacterium]